MSDHDKPAESRPPPSFKGLKLYADQHICFLWPSNWHRFTWPGHEQAVVLGPVPDDQATLFAVETTELGMPIKPDDLDDLEKGFIEGIKQMTDCDIESYDRWSNAEGIGVEAKYTFREGENVRKRWVRLHYHNDKQISVTSQGSTVEEFHYWLPMFFEATMTLRTHNCGNDQTEILRQVYGVS